MLRTGTISHSYTLDEHHLYAASRLGMETYQNITLADVQTTTLPFGTFVTPYPVTVNDEFAEKREVKMKRYELNSHQSSVHITVSDRKLSVQHGTTTHTAFYTADVVSYGDYYSFGMQKPERFGSEPDAKYRYGLQGKEKDNEWAGDGNSVDFGARMYDPRLGRWRSMDAHASKYPGLSPYNFVTNSPLLYIDPDGNDIYVTTIAKKNLVSVFRKLDVHDANGVVVKSGEDVLGVEQLDANIFTSTLKGTEKSFQKQLKKLGITDPETVRLATNTYKLLRQVDLIELGTIDTETEQIQVHGENSEEGSGIIGFFNASGNYHPVTGEKTEYQARDFTKIMDKYIGGQEFSDALKYGSAYDLSGSSQGKKLNYIDRVIVYDVDKISDALELGAKSIDDFHLKHRTKLNKKGTVSDGYVHRKQKNNVPSIDP